MKLIVMEDLLSILTTNGARSFIAVSVAVRHGQLKNLTLKRVFSSINLLILSLLCDYYCTHTLKIDVPS